MPRRTHRLVLILASAILLALAACGGSGPAVGTSGSAAAGSPSIGTSGSGAPASAASAPTGASATSIPSASPGSASSASPGTPVRLDDGTRAQLQASFEETFAAATVDGVPTPGAI